MWYSTQSGRTKRMRRPSSRSSPSPPGRGGAGSRSPGRPGASAACPPHGATVPAVRPPPATRGRRSSSQPRLLDDLVECPGRAGVLPGRLHLLVRERPPPARPRRVELADQVPLPVAQLLPLGQPLELRPDLVRQNDLAHRTPSFPDTIPRPPGRRNRGLTPPARPVVPPHPLSISSCFMPD